MNHLTFYTIAFRNDPIEEILPKVARIGYDAAEVFWGQLDGKSDADLRAVAQRQPRSFDGRGCSAWRRSPLQQSPNAEQATERRIRHV